MSRFQQEMLPFESAARGSRPAPDKPRKPRKAPRKPRAARASPKGSSGRLSAESMAASRAGSPILTASGYIVARRKAVVSAKIQ